MIRPTLKISRQGTSGSDIYGQPLLGGVTYELVAPVKLQFDVQHTTVRTDSAASHGHASENTAAVILLALPKSKIAPNDILMVIGNKLKVVRIHKRYTVAGVFDHIEVHCTAWK